MLNRIDSNKGTYFGALCDNIGSGTATPAMADDRNVFCALVRSLLLDPFLEFIFISVCKIVNDDALMLFSKIK